MGIRAQEHKGTRAEGLKNIRISDHKGIRA